MLVDEKGGAFAVGDAGVAIICGTTRNTGGHLTSIETGRTWCTPLNLTTQNIYSTNYHPWTSLSFPPSRQTRGTQNRSNFA